MTEVQSHTNDVKLICSRVLEVQVELLIQYICLVVMEKSGVRNVFLGGLRGGWTEARAHDGYFCYSKEYCLLVLIALIKSKLFETLEMDATCRPKHQKSRNSCEDVETNVATSSHGRCLHPCAPAGVSLLGKTAGCLEQPCHQDAFNIGRTSTIVARGSTRNKKTHSVRRNLYAARRSS